MTSVCVLISFLGVVRAGWLPWCACTSDVRCRAAWCGGGRGGGGGWFMRQMDE